MVSTLGRRTLLKGAAALALASCAPTASTGATGASPSGAARASVPFKWLFGFTVQAGPTLPVILAKEEGYYQTESIDMSWDFTTDSSGIRLIGTGQYQAGSVSDILALTGYVSQGVPLRAIAQQSTTTARAFAVKQGSGIKRPKDWEGKKVGLKPGPPWAEYLAMLKGDNVDRSKITEVPVGYSSVELKNGIVDVLPVFVSNEPYVLKNSLNTPVDLIYPKDYGAPFVGTIMVANADFIKQQRDAALRFLKATQKGEEFFLSNKDQTIQTTVQYGGTATTRAQDEFSYGVYAPLMTDPHGPGWIDVDLWQKNIDLLASLGLLKTTPKVSDLVDASLIQDVLKDGKVVWP